jgi:hypothetical protein
MGGGIVSKSHLIISGGSYFYSKNIFTQKKKIVTLIVGRGQILDFYLSNAYLYFH